jgi:hypothetical protein
MPLSWPPRQLDGCGDGNFSGGTNMVSDSRNGLTRRDLLCRGLVGAAGLISLPPLLGYSSVARAQTSGGYPTPLSGKGQWEANAREWGGYVKAYLERNQANDAGLNATYYDFMRVAFQNGDYFGDPNTWNAAAVTARGPYRDYYVNRNNGAIPGFWNFTEGLLQDWLRNRDATSLQALRLIRQNGSFVNSTGYNDSVMADAAYSRETAYALECCLNAWRAGIRWIQRV